MPMPTLTDRVTALETRADVTDERVEALEEWLSDESRLREIDEKRIELLEQAAAIHARRSKRR
jgi:hypothetical protein